MNHYSVSQVKDFIQCPTKWAFRSFYRLDPLTKTVALTSGAITHECLAAFYRCPPNKRSFRVLENALNTSWANYNVSADEYASISDTIYKRLTKYWAQYQEDETILADAIEHTYTIDYDNYKVIVKPDLIVSNGKGFALWETKTGKPNIENFVFDDFQMIIYLSELHKLQIPVEYSILQLIPDSGECTRLDIDYDAYEVAVMANWFHLRIQDIIMFRQFLQEEQMESMKNAYAKLIQLSAYGWQCGNCAYNILCRGIRQALDIDEIISNNFEKRNNERNQPV